MRGGVPGNLGIWDVFLFSESGVHIRLCILSMVNCVHYKGGKDQGQGQGQGHGHGVETWIWCRDKDG